MNWTRSTAVAALMGATVLSSAALAQEGHGTVTFTVHVTGAHNVPIPGGGFRNVTKNRVFRGKARLKYAGRSFAVPPTQGYDKARFEREKDACEDKSSEEAIAACQDEVQERQNAAERAAMTGMNPMTAAVPRTEVWATESCSGEIEVADTGTYRSIPDWEAGSGMVNTPYTLSAKEQITAGSPTGISCAFTLMFDPQKQTAHISIEPGPPRIEVLERVGVARKMHINPFDWSAIRKFEKGNIKVTGGANSHSGVWNESTGEPMALAGEARVKGEVVQTTTRITWQFAGQPQPK